MKPSNLNPAEYLHAEDLLNDGKWSEYTLKIREVLKPNTVKAADGKLIGKPILLFEKTDKRLVLGATNERLLKCALGTAKVPSWVGMQVTIYAATGDWFGQKNVAAIRVRIPEGVTKPFIQPKQLGKDITGKQVAVA